MAWEKQYWGTSNYSFGFDVGAVVPFSLEFCFSDALGRLCMLVSFPLKIWCSEWPWLQRAYFVVLQAVLCVKVNANKVRQAALEVILGVGKAFVRWQLEDPSGAIKDLLSQLTAGFTGSAYLVSCTVLALSNVLHRFKGWLLFL